VRSIICAISSLGSWCMDVNRVFISHAWAWISCTVVVVLSVVMEVFVEVMVLVRWRMESRIDAVERVSPSTPLFPEKVVDVGKGNMGERTLGG
jgi:hypothetical protein